MSGIRFNPANTMLSYTPKPKTEGAISIQKTIPLTDIKRDIKTDIKSGDSKNYDRYRGEGLSKDNIIKILEKADPQSKVEEISSRIDELETKYNSKISGLKADLIGIPKPSQSLDTPRGGSIALTPSVLASSSGKVQASGSIPTTPRARIASSITPDFASSEQKDFSWSHKFLQEGGLIKKAYKIVDQHEEGKICHEFALPNCPNYYVEPESLADIRKWAEPGKTIAVCFAKGQVAHTAVMSGRDSFVQSLARKTESTTGNHGTIFETTFKTLTLMYPKVMIIKPGDNTDDAMWEKARSGTNLREPRTSDDLRTRLSLEAHGVEIH